jgi:hypothetical protein
MEREEDSRTPAEDHDEVREDSSGTSRHRSWWERPLDSPPELYEVSAPGEPADVTGADTGYGPVGAAPAAGCPRRRALRVAVGGGAAVELAGGGFGVGHAVADATSGGAPSAAFGHHCEHDGRRGFGGQGRPGQGQSGQNTSAGSGPVLGGLFR